VGWLLNRELPVLRQRPRSSAPSPFYRKKGTRRGLIDLIQGIMNWDMEVIKYNRNILMTGTGKHDAESKRDPNVTMNMDTCRRHGGLHSRRRQIPRDRNPHQDQGTTTSTCSRKSRNKLFRILRFWVPACMSVILELATYNEESGSIADWRPAQADLLATKLAS